MQASGSSGFLLYRVRALRFSRMKYHMSPVTQVAFCSFAEFAFITFHPFLFIPSGYHRNACAIQKPAKPEPRIIVITLKCARYNKVNKQPRVA